MEGAYIIIGGGLLVFLVLAFIVFKQMSRRGDFTRPKSKNYYLGMGMALGMAIGIPLGLLIGFALEKIALGISIGPALGAGFGTMIGSLLEKRYNATPIVQEDEYMISGKKAFRGVIAGLSAMVILILIIFILIN